LQQRNADQEQRNAELEREVKELKSRNGPFAPILSGPEEKATAGNDNKAVFTAPPPPNWGDQCHQTSPFSIARGKA
jgi:hypothetical protein